MFKKNKPNKVFRSNSPLNSEALKRFKAKDPIKSYLTKKNLYHLESFLKKEISKHYYSKRRITNVLPREKKQSFGLFKQIKKNILAGYSAYKS